MAVPRLLTVVMVKMKEKMSVSDVGVIGKMS